MASLLRVQSLVSRSWPQISESQSSELTSIIYSLREYCSVDIDNKFFLKALTELDPKKLKTKDKAKLFSLRKHVSNVTVVDDTIGRAKPRVATKKRNKLLDFDDSKDISLFEEEVEEKRLRQKGIDKAKQEAKKANKKNESSLRHRASKLDTKSIISSRRDKRYISTSDEYDVFNDNIQEVERKLKQKQNESDEFSLRRGHDAKKLMIERLKKVSENFADDEEKISKRTRKRPEKVVKSKLQFTPSQMREMAAKSRAQKKFAKQARRQTIVEAKTEASDEKSDIDSAVFLNGHRWIHKEDLDIKCGFKLAEGLYASGTVVYYNTVWFSQYGEVRPMANDFCKRFCNSKHIFSDHSKRSTTKDYFQPQPFKTFSEKATGILGGLRGLDIDGILTPDQHFCLDKIQTYCILFYQLYRASSATDCYSVVYMFLNSQRRGLKTLSNMSISALSSAIWYALRRFFYTPEGKVVTEAFSDTCIDFGNVLRCIAGSEVVSAFSRIVLAAASLQFFSKDISHKLYRYIGKPEKMSVLGLVHESLEFIGKIARVAELIICGSSLSDALFEKDPITAHMNASTELLLFRDKVYEGLPTPGWMSKSEFCEKAKEHIDFFDAAEKASYKNKRFGPDIVKRRLDLTDAYSTCMAQMAQNGRIPPIAVLIESAPGVGKSGIIDFICAIHAAVKGYKFTPHMIYPRSRTSDFCEGYLMHSHKYMHYSELGDVSQGLAKSQGDRRVSEICSVVDSQKMYVDMAFGDKGKVMMLADMVIIDTNNAGMNLDIVVSNPAAVRRRILYVHPTVKEKYRKNPDDPSSGIDASKCNDGSFFYDRWTFNVYVMVPRGSIHSDRQDFVNKRGSLHFDVDDLHEFLTERFRKHIEVEEGILKERASAIDSLIARYPNRDPQEFLDAIITNSGGNSVSILPEKEDPRIKIGNCQDGYGISFGLSDEVPYDISSLKYQISAVTICLHLPMYIRNSLLICFLAMEWDRIKATPNDAKKTYKMRICWYLFLAFLKFLFAVAYNGVQTGAYLVLSSWSRLFYQFMPTHDGFFHMTPFRTMWFAASIWFWPFAGSWYFVRVLLPFVNWNWFIPASTVKKYSDDWEEKYHFYRSAADAGRAIYSTLDTHKYAILACGSLAAIVKMYMTHADSDEVFAEATTTDDLSETSRLLREKEIMMGCSRPLPRKENRAISEWNFKRPTFVPVHTSDAPSLSLKISRNLRLVKNGSRHSYVLGVFGNWAVINRHILSKDRVTRLRLAETPGSNSESSLRPIEVDTAASIVLNQDLLLIRIDSCSFMDIRKHIVDSHLPEGTFSGWIGGEDTSINVCGSVVDAMDSVHGKIRMSGVYQYVWKGHKPGMCGFPLLAKIGGGWTIVGIHSAGGSGNDMGFSLPLNSRTLEHLNPNVDSFMPISSTCFEDPVITNSGVFLDDPIPKSPMCYENFDGMRYHGKIKGNVVMRNKSKLCESPLSTKGDLNTMFFEILNFVPNVQYVKPMMYPQTVNGEYLSPYNIACRKMNQPKVALDKTVLNEIIDELTERIVTQLKEKGVKPLHPMTMDCAINGAVEDPFLRRIDLTTSSGFPWKGVKKSLTETVSENCHMPNSELAERLLVELGKYEKGIRTPVIYSAQLKDEPRDREKVKQGKTRLFYVSPFDNLILSRMFLSPFYTLMVEHGDIFCSAVGINMHKEAMKIYDVLTDFSRYIMEGDYGSYDLCMPYDIGWAACSVIYNVLMMMGYSESAMKVVQGLLTDSLHPWIEMNLDLFEVPGLQPSGKYATAEDNCLRGLILMMYAWKKMNPEFSRDFFKNVLPRLYGDDMLAAVSKDHIGVFNNVTYAKFVRENFGMTFTSSSKGDVVDEFVSVEEMSFLKRKFVYSESLERIVAPLDMNSLYRSLQWILPSASVSQMNQLLGTYNAFLRELMFHVGRVQFDQCRDVLMKFMIDEYKCEVCIVEKFLPTFDILRDDLCSHLSSCSEEMTGREGRQCVEFAATTESYCGSVDLFDTVYNDKIVPGLNEPRTNGKSFMRFYQEVRKSLERMQEDLEIQRKVLEGMENPSPSTDPRFLRKNPNYYRDRHFQKSADVYIQQFLKVEDLEKTIIVYQTSLARRNSVTRAVTEAGEDDVDSTTVSPAVVEVIENMTDMSGQTEEELIVGDYSATKYLGDPDLNPTEFFSRPVIALKLSLPLNDRSGTSINLWESFMLNSAVRSKYRNYAFFRATLCYKITISGSPFHYGKVMCAYLPYPDTNPFIGPFVAQLDNMPYVKYLAQTPFAVTMDIRENKPQVVKIPWISTVPYSRLFKESTATNSTLSESLLAMGKLYLETIHDIKAVSTTASPPFLTVYCWLEDVELGCPTGTVMSIVTEAGDERKVGPVEKVASNMVSISNVMSKIPGIGSFASQAGTVARGVEKLSALFGWSYPNAVLNPQRMKNEPFQNGAQTIGMDTGKKISLDPLQQLTVNPSFSGMSEDELAISYIVARESLLSSFNWAPTDAEQAGPIWFNAVTPRAFQTTSVNNLVQPTTLDFAATPFLYWRGTISYRLQAEVSAFHRGKLAIFYEPNVSQVNAIAANFSTNKQFIMMWDLQEAQEICFDVDWAHKLPWCYNLPDYAVETTGASLPSPVYLADYCNGVIYAVPFTELQSPDDSEIFINVYVHSKDMVFNELMDNNMPHKWHIVTESGDDEKSMTCMVLNPTGATTEGITQDYFGELPLSFRSLIKRFVSTSYLYNDGAITDSKTAEATFPIFPALLPNATTDLPSNYPFHLISYLRPAYLCMRGGVRKRIMINSPSTNTVNPVKIFLDNPDTAAAAQGFVNGTVPIFANLHGSVTFVPITNAGFEVELPNYMNNLFVMSMSTDPYVTGLYGVENLAPKTYTTATWPKAAVAAGYFYFTEETAAADDFSLNCFIAAYPRKY